MKGAAIRNVVLLRFTNNPPEFTSHCHIASTKTHVASTMTHWLFTNMAMRSNVTNHSPVLPTIHFCTTRTTFEMALASEITRCSTVTNHPSRSMHAACGMVSAGMTGSITVSCQRPLLVRSGHAASCWCFAADSPHANSHTLHGQQGWRALPSECAHHPRFPVQGHCAAGWSKHFQWPIHNHQMVGCRMPCTPLRVCTPPQLPNLGPLNRRQSGQLHFQWPIHIHQMVGCRTPCTPLRVCTPPQLPNLGPLNRRLSSPFHFQWPIHIHRMVGCRTPCTPLRVCTPSQLPNPGQHRHWCWAEDINK